MVGSVATGNTSTDAAHLSGAVNPALRENGPPLIWVIALNSDLTSQLHRIDQRTVLS